MAVVEVVVVDSVAVVVGSLATDAGISAPPVKGFVSAAGAPAKGGTRGGKASPDLVSGVSIYGSVVA